MAPAPGDGAQRVRLRFLPEGAEVRVPSGTPVFDAASWNGIAIDSTCGGHGTCKKCRVRIVSGDVPVGPLDPRAFTTDELRDGWRLACRASARGDLVVEVPPLQTRPKAALAGVGRHVILRPAVQKRHLVLDEPTMEDQRSDLQRVLDELDDLEPHASIEVLRSLGSVLRSSGFDVTAVVCDQELIDLEPGDTTARRFAIAFDLGTTTVVATLLDLESGQPVAVRSMLNRQQPYGADVITRISATMMDDDALEALRSRVHETLAELVGEVCADGAVEPREVYEITVCGNVTMMHLALGIDPEPLSMAPFVVSTHSFGDVLARDFGIEVHPRAPAFVFPSLGAYVGGDIVAGMLATGLTRDRRAAAVHRRRHEQRDRARLARARGRDRGARRAGVRGRADPVRHAGVGGRDRGREDLRLRRGRARRDRGHRAGRDVRVGAGRRGRRARALRAARPLGAVHPR